MKKFLQYALLCSLTAVQLATAQTSNEIRLIVRSDDIGFCHAVNQACIEVYKNGISRSVEILAPSPWFPEAVAMLKANPGYDVGVHLCLTSEWETLRWRPLTAAPSLTDADGYFHPFVWQNKTDARSFLLAKPIDLAEAERELRAQIELVRRHLPWVSHLSAHMGFSRATPELTALVNRLAQEYKLPLEMPAGVVPVRGFGGSSKSPAEKEKALVEILEKLTPGTHFLIEHPGYDTAEMKTIGHKGYENVAFDREGVTKAFTSKRVMDVVKRRNIKLISVKEAIQQP